MTREDALEMLRETARVLGEVDRPPSLVSYWAGRVAGIEFAVKVLESEDGDVA